MTVMMRKEGRGTKPSCTRPPACTTFRTPTPHTHPQNATSLRITRAQPAQTPLLQDTGTCVYVCYSPMVQLWCRAALAPPDAVGSGRARRGRSSQPRLLPAFSSARRRYRSALPSLHNAALA